jgi:GSH-dependent disulfide-bond oxidoreductase
LTFITGQPPTARPATIRAYEKAEAFKNQQISPEQVRDLLFNQSANTVKR